MTDDTRKQSGWCRDERLRVGLDELIEKTSDYTLVHCMGEFSAQNIHAGKWILWSAVGKCLAVGSEQWVRSRIPVEALR